MNILWAITKILKNNYKNMFKYITQAEFDKLKFQAGRSGHIKTKERLELESLKVGKGVIIEKKNWSLKSEPSSMMTISTPS